MSSGGRGISPSTSKRALQILGPFQGQNCITKELAKSRYTCCFNLCGAHCVVQQILYILSMNIEQEKNCLSTLIYSITLLAGDKDFQLYKKFARVQKLQTVFL
jgi:hypothetical protein